MSIPTTTTSGVVGLTAAQIDAGLFNTDGYRLVPGQFTYSIPTASSIWSGYDAGSEPYTNYAALTGTQANQFRAAMTLWDSYIAPSFAEVSDSTPGFVRVAFTAISDADTAAYAYTGQGAGAQDPLVGDIWINDTGSTPAARDFSAGTYGFETLLHEIGHTLGLKHSFEAPVIPDPYDTTRYTIMSYTDPMDSIVTQFSMGANGRLQSYQGYVSAITPMVLDIQAVQDLYGADPTTHAGDDYYDFSRSRFDVFQTIYDAGGQDTISGNYGRPNIIDLHPGSYSTIGYYSVAAQEAADIAQYGQAYASFIRAQFDDAHSYTGTDNLGIAFSTTIENAIGGDADDTLIGNDVANRLNGGGGNDVLTGGGGADTLWGQDGKDIYRDTAAGLDHDTIEGIEPGERIEIIDATTAGFGFSYTGSTLTLGGGQTITVATQPSRYLAIDPATSRSDGDVTLLLHAHDAKLNDFDGDGLSDILWRKTNGDLSTWSVTDAGAYDVRQNTNYIAGVGSGWSLQGTTDVTGDHLADLVWHNASSGQLAIWDANGSGGFTQSSYLSGSVTLDWSVAGEGDFNGDGRDDIIWHSSSGALSEWTSTGNGFDQNAVYRPVDTSWHVEGVGDFNYDGASDVLWRNDGGQVTYWSGDPYGHSGNLSDTNVYGYADRSWHIQSVADFNGDGVSDILWRNDNGSLNIWTPQLGSASFNTSFYFHGAIGSDWSIVATGDYNGDGMADILWHNTNGTFSFWQSTGTGFVESAYNNSSVGTDWTPITTHYDLI